MPSRKILVVRQDKLGDLLLTTPLLRGLSNVAEVDLIAQPIWEPIWSRLAFLRQVLPTPYRLGPMGAFQLGARLRKWGYEAAILAKENSGDHLLAAKVARIPMRVGHATKNYAKWLTHNVTPPDVHEVVRLQAYGAVVLSGTSPPAPSPRSGEGVLTGPLEFPVLPSELAETPAGRYAVCAPATGGTCPAWEPEGWRALLARFEQDGVRSIVVGAPGEEAIAAAVCEGTDRVNLAGQLTLGELAAHLKRAERVLCGNTGALHLAATQQTPTIVVETQSDADYYARRWAPWKTPAVHLHAFGQTIDEVLAQL
jgi:heptosyltransferase II